MGAGRCHPCATKTHHPSVCVPPPLPPYNPGGAFPSYNLLLEYTQDKGKGKGKGEGEGEGECEGE